MNIIDHKENLEDIKERDRYMGRSSLEIGPILEVHMMIACRKKYEDRYDRLNS